MNTPSTPDDGFKRLQLRCVMADGTGIWSDPREPRLEAFDHAIDARRAQVFGDPTTGYDPHYRPVLTGGSTSGRGKGRKHKDKNQQQDQGPWQLQ